MRSDHPPAIRLEDYRVPDFLIDRVGLDIVLAADKAVVTSTLSVRRNPAAPAGRPLVLDGDELKLTGLAVDGALLAATAYEATPAKLTIHTVPERFTLTVVTELTPGANTRLMGLYRSNGIYCTQCEAEGFRRITYFPDRPDVLAPYRVRLEADKAQAPVLLANGNRSEAGDIAGTGRHFAVWDDPHPKPSYLFAIVAGDLDTLHDSFITSSGRKVALGIHVEKGKLGQTAYAMDALKRSMAWDEQVFGREYDLDVFNIVAVSDFNFGAMENKGLNIFNDKYVLASPETATDSDYANIEAVIAHEYFHNWTGNRITCRDWFQLCLKEGLTVFRDQEFSSDMRSRPVKRIADVRNLRSQQFVEDGGPLAHPVRPSAYREINNFYTMTIYEKGAELIRMLKTLLGEAGFAAGLALYFKRCDGTAATVEDFIGCFAEATGRDLTQFMRWYAQAGTPKVAIAAHYDAAARTLTLDLSQETPPTPEQPDKLPVVIPLRIGLLDRAGNKLTPRTGTGKAEDEIVVALTAREQRVVLHDVPSEPIISALRGFSAPVNLDFPQGERDLAVLARHDSDPFNRWQALQMLAMGALLSRTGVAPVSHGGQDSLVLIEAFGALLPGAGADPAFTALALTLPGESDIARQIGRDIDPDAIASARRGLRTRIGEAHRGALIALHGALAEPAQYSPDAASAGRRSLRNTILDLIAAADAALGERLAVEAFTAAGNMTDRLAALSTLCILGGPAREEALAAFEQRFSREALAIDKWFALQATIPEADTLARVRRLMEHPGFALTNPNRARALIGSFAMANLTQFNAADGAGYRFVAEMVLTIDPGNPQVAARLLTAFRTWRTMETGRRRHAESALQHIAAAKKLSPDVRDIVERTLR